MEFDCEWWVLIIVNTDLSQSKWIWVRIGGLGLDLKEQEKTSFKQAHVPVEKVYSYPCLKNY